jgi:hypothetical protein
MSHDHSKPEKWKFQEDGHLSVLFNELLKNYDGIELNDANTFQSRILFTNNSLGDEEVAGKCMKISGVIRHLWGVDFIVLIQKTCWDAATPLEKTRILAHEAHHMKESEDGEPTVRKHGGDFCSIPEHDKQSYRIAELVYKKLKNLKEFTTQQEITVTV